MSVSDQVYSRALRALFRALFGPLFLALVLMVGAFSVESSAYAQDRTGEIDEIFSGVSPEGPGCAVGISQNGQQIVSRSYGLADVERSIPIAPSTIFDIGSIQKQFVAAAILLLVDDGRIALSDDVREYFPELPDYGHTVTVDHLLTHTSGLRDWIGLSRMSSENEDALTMIFRQRGLNFAPGSEWAYSNTGYVLLKELVRRVSGLAFSEFAKERLFDPLGMTSTSFAQDIRAAGDRGAVAYEKEGDGWRPDVMLGTERGDGAVLSTAEDLLIWNEALTDARLGTFITDKIQEPARLNNGRKLDYARGLFLDVVRGNKAIWHTGSAGAYKSMLARFPEHGFSLAVLCNAGESADRGRFAQRIVSLFVPSALGTEVPRAADSVDGVDLNGVEGTFFSARTGEPIHLVVRDGKLHVAGGPSLVAMAEGRFRNPAGDLSFMSGDRFEIRFLSPDEFEMTSMEGETTRYRRAEPHAPSDAEMRELAGRYESDELNAVLEVDAAVDGLKIRLNDSEPYDFSPMGFETFQLGRMLGRFLRDADGNVIAISYSNPALRKVTFTRVEDGTARPVPDSNVK